MVQRILNLWVPAKQKNPFKGLLLSFLIFLLIFAPSLQHNTRWHPRGGGPYPLKGASHGATFEVSKKMSSNKWIVFTKNLFPFQLGANLLDFVQSFSSQTGIGMGIGRREWECRDLTSNQHQTLRRVRTTGWLVAACP